MVASTGIVRIPRTGWSCIRVFIDDILRPGGVVAPHALALTSQELDLIDKGI